VCVAFYNKLMNPEPSGRRSSPPPRVRTALSAGGAPGDRVIALHLLDEAEEDLLTTAFERLNWRVLHAGDLLFLIAVCDEHPQIVVTDDPTLCGELPMDWDIKCPDMVVIVDDRDSAVEGAWRAGADWVVKRGCHPVERLWQRRGVTCKRREPRWGFLPRLREPHQQ
jgi:hypothetical protein